MRVDGPGVLQALGSANPATEEGFTETSCTTFDGRALAVVRPTGAGQITVRATAEGCEPQQVVIDARVLSRERVPHDLGAALAPVPRPVGPLHVAPGRPALDR